MGNRTIDVENFLQEIPDAPIRDIETLIIHNLNILIGYFGETRKYKALKTVQCAKQAIKELQELEREA